MSDTSAGHPDGAGRYKILIKGDLPSRWATWFDGMSLTADDDATCLEGFVVDQAALYGLLDRVRDVGLPLLSVNRLDADGAHASPTSYNSHPGD